MEALSIVWSPFACSVLDKDSDSFYSRKCSTCYCCYNIVSFSLTKGSFSFVGVCTKWTRTLSTPQSKIKEKFCYIIIVLDDEK